MKYSWVVAILITVSNASAFEIDGSKWPGGKTRFFVALEGTSPSGISWNQAIMDAVGLWNNDTEFELQLSGEFRDPCADDRHNGAGFNNSVCGDEFGNSIIAVTIIQSEFSLLGPPVLAETDIVFNSNKTFDVFDGPQGQFSLGTLLSPIDFRRVALHELGHAIGLGHEPSQPAIMNATIGDLFTLQQDDIAGVATLYGGLANCMIKPLSELEPVTDGLLPGDCTVQQLTVGSDDTSLIDVHHLELSETAEITLEMTSNSLDSVVLVADERLQILGLDDNGGAGCDARLSMTLGPGKYYVLANTYANVSECGELTGPYELNLLVQESALDYLGSSTSVLGGNANAGFFGLITDSSGLAANSTFAASAALDVTTRIQVDPRHVGQAGFLVAAAVIDAQLFLLDPQGQLIPFDAAIDAYIPYISKQLAATENLVLASGLVPASLGVSEIQADIYVGYGLFLNASELYFHSQPLQLNIIP